MAERMSARRVGGRLIGAAPFRQGLDARGLKWAVVGFTAPRRSQPYFGALVLAVGDRDGWRYVGHDGTGFSYSALNELYGSALWRISLNRCAVDQHGRAAGEFPDSFLRLSP